MTGKLDVAFGLGGNSVAGSGAITPSPDGSEHVAVTEPASALQNKWAVYPAVCSYDEVDLNLQFLAESGQKRIRRGQSLRRLDVETTGAPAFVRDLTVFSSTGWRLPNLAFAVVQGLMAELDGRCLHRGGTHAASNEYRNAEADAGSHAVKRKCQVKQLSRLHPATARPNFEFA